MGTYDIRYNTIWSTENVTWTILYTLSDMLCVARPVKKPSSHEATPAVVRGLVQGCIHAVNQAHTYASSSAGRPTSLRCSAGVPLSNIPPRHDDEVLVSPRGSRISAGTATYSSSSRGHVVQNIFRGVYAAAAAATVGQRSHVGHMKLASCGCGALCVACGVLCVGVRGVAVGVSGFTRVLVTNNR